LVGLEVLEEQLRQQELGLELDQERHRSGNQQELVRK
jgi:hypothetical protein